MGSRCGIAALVVPLLVVSPVAQAAGGHHAVEDAELLDAGQCQVEAWWERADGGVRSLLVAAPACRVGAVELGVQLGHLRTRGDDASTTAGAQLKWAQGLGHGWSAGVALGVAGHDRRPRFVGGVVVLPVTWQASETWLVHANIGRDLRHDEPDANRSGVAVEWTPRADVSLVAERFSEGGAAAWRAGLRWTVTPATSVDLSRARSLGGGAPSWWTLGWTWVFDR